MVSSNSPIQYEAIEYLQISVAQKMPKIEIISHGLLHKFRPKKKQNHIFSCFLWH